jgi:mRNA-degrading endonuclease toxin of MazEF toxin-antitoxin module
MKNNFLKFKSGEKRDLIFLPPENQEYKTTQPWIIVTKEKFKNYISYDLNCPICEAREKIKKEK